ncbi:MAG: acyl-CoA dehydrogenase [Alphaproteobacteria bacterium]|nr:acyl-CoA dehydrogenase [Alphaproteobacteria bacterium]
MSAYAAPLADLRFALGQVFDLKTLAGLKEFEHATPDVIDAALEEAARLAGEAIAPLNGPGDRIGSKLDNGVVRTPPGFKEAYRQFVEGGWNGVAFDPAYGGQGLPWLVAMAVQEMWTSANMAWSLCALLTQGAVEAVAAHGSDSQKALFLEKMVSGQWTGTMNLTEPHAGSDVGALRSRAEPAGDGTWRIKGTKIFITYGEHDMAENIVHLVLARTPGSPPGTKGISLFLVPKFLVEEDGGLGRRNDLRCVSLEHKLGIHASPTAVMSFGDQDGAIGTLIGRENEGMRCMFTMMNNARLSVGLQGVAISERAYQQAAAFARERKQGRIAGMKSTDSAPIVAHPDIRRSLMTMRANTEAMRLLVLQIAESMDFAHRHPDKALARRRQEWVELLTPVAKAHATDLGVEMTSLGLQIHGGMGFVEETGAAQHLRDSRIAPIYEGTNGIQAIDLVARKLPIGGGAAVRALIGDMAKAPGLADACKALSASTEWMLATLPKDADAALAGATPYCRQFGIVAGGWLMARAAEAAAKQAGKGEGDAAFLAAKQATARFYAQQILPLAAALTGPITAGKDAVMALAAEAL